MINVSLSNMSEFLKYKGQTLENVIAKRGKCLFPAPTFTITDLNPKHHYQMSLSFQQSKTTMEYVSRSNEWKPTCVALAYAEQDVPHKSGVKNGKFWMEEAIEFEHLRLTNCKENQTLSTVFMNSRHKYIPILKVSRMNLSSTGWERVETESLKFSFEETSFVAVTKYVNKKVCALKTKLNKFAGHKTTENSQLESEGTQRKRKSEGNESAGDAKRQKQMEPAVQHHDPLQTFNVPAQPIPSFATPLPYYFHPQTDIYPQTHYIPLPTFLNPTQVMTQFPYAPVALNYPVPELMGYPTVFQPQSAQPSFYQQYPPYF